LKVFWAFPLHCVLRVGVNLPSLLQGGIQPPFPPIRRDTTSLPSYKEGYNLPSLLQGGIQPPFPPIRRDIGRLLSPKGSAAFAPPNIGRVSEGRGGFGALRIPHASQSFSSITNSFFFFIPLNKLTKKFCSTKKSL
jgi:hypothetical protein